MKFNSFIIIILCVFFSSCFEEYDLNLENDKPRLVIEGVITDLSGPYYIRLTKSKTGINSSGSNFFDDNYEGVKDATITITDNTGIIDTLVPIPSKVCYSYIYDENQNVIDSVIVDCNDYITYEKGYYQTTKIKGVAGNSYILYIKSDNKEYTAEAYMPEVPKIDSLTYMIVETEKEEVEQLVPLIYFPEPHEKNYYLFQLTTPDYIFSGMSAYEVWNFSILEDEFLPHYVSGLNISVGTSPDGFNFYNYSTDSNHYPIVSVTMSSLTSDAYYYYKSLIEQYKNDGGAYSPAPASPTGNISGDALGFFRASAISSITKTFEIQLPMKK